MRGTLAFVFLFLFSQINAQTGSGTQFPSPQNPPSTIVASTTSIVMGQNGLLSLEHEVNPLIFLEDKEVEFMFFDKFVKEHSAEDLHYLIDAIKSKKVVTKVRVPDFLMTTNNQNLRKM